MDGTNGVYCIPFFMSMVFQMINFHTERKKSFHKHFNNKGCNTKVKNFIFFTCRKQKRKRKDLTWISEKGAFFWPEPDILRASKPVATQIRSDFVYLVSLSHLMDVVQSVTDTLPGGTGASLHVVM